MELTLRSEAHDEEGLAQQGEIDFPATTVKAEEGREEKKERGYVVGPFV